MKILILSDSHGDTAVTEKIVRRERPDHLLFLGDGLRDTEELARIFPTLPICGVKGNNDWMSDEETEKTILLAGTRIFLCHGHTTGVRQTTDVQWLRARQKNCTVSLFGHTHSQYLEERDGILLLNPGTAMRDLYAVLTLRPGEKPTAELKRDY